MENFQKIPGICSCAGDYFHPRFAMSNVQCLRSCIKLDNENELARDGKLVHEKGEVWYIMATQSEFLQTSRNASSDTVALFMFPWSRTPGPAQVPTSGRRPLSRSSLTKRGCWLTGRPCTTLKEPKKLLLQRRHEEVPKYCWPCSAHNLYRHPSVQSNFLKNESIIRRS